MRVRGEGRGEEGRERDGEGGMGGEGVWVEEGVR